MIPKAKIILTKQILWTVDPFDAIHSIWGEVMNAPASSAVPHLVGTLEIVGNRVINLDLDVVFHEKEREALLKDGEKVYVLLPVDPLEGVEGAYLRLQALVEGVQ
ncbi:hypothetical protein FH039_07360 [Thermococcus indicus]|uniref:Uncharacterized protein n=1 Tax=Thermococcus indicus TaxID=2586643 RepID=A0A4Y5SMM3_9EURY|nr:hypothetical protein [Thermococcus indicus]QDA31449.1 hypothetical protein FH039_07360 [Thermococcus indicus]